jgi:hypothetical protein
MTAFHKDTLGKTLFVNLNFLTGEGLGPEYVVNPATNEDYEEWFAQANRLPSTFVKDVEGAKKALGAPTEIGATKVPAKGLRCFC